MKKSTAIFKFAEKLLRPHQELVEICYFSAKPTDLQKSKRQDAFFQVNKLNRKFALHLGKYLTKDITCKFCNMVNHSFEEKETDVRIATTMLADVYQKRCDITMLVSADSDLVPPIERIKEFSPAHKIIVCFPPNRHSLNLKKWSNGVKALTDWKLYDECLLPETVTLPDGFFWNGRINGDNPKNINNMSTDKRNIHIVMIESALSKLTIITRNYWLTYRRFIMGLESKYLSGPGSWESSGCYLMAS